VVVVDIEDYDTVIDGLNEHNGAISSELSRYLAAKAYNRTAAYDAIIGSWFSSQLGSLRTFPYHTISGQNGKELRYGENPHQWSAFYQTSETRPGVATAFKCQGKSLSYNNINDTDVAFELISEFGAQTAAVAIVKHANPCGVATGISLRDAYIRALRCDPVSAFGGIVALNQTIDEDSANEIIKVFTEVIIAPDASEGAKAIFSKKLNLRVLLTGLLADPAENSFTMKTLASGLLLQSRDNAVVDQMNLKVVTKRKPTDKEMSDLKFAFRVVKHVKSNAIVYAKDGATVGIGAGQMSRVASVRIAAQNPGGIEQAIRLENVPTYQSVLASDAFFPFSDGIHAAAEAGVTAIIQPGGSIRDRDIISAANTNNMAMIFTGIRHFKH
ncbi:MAG: bifunctional phosphoribosylaminoimidazolecarboxamide formyltransferase/IMP cyclohydrolase, partial [Hyphomicrobiaceae bacterium]|nr:bifunctional phosphoribosylaminoimidazolecarboxamide formyltransferase/IMP cyclohydrolase [Hyphomicrobiaceae bacterium]